MQLCSRDCERSRIESISQGLWSVCSFDRNIEPVRRRFISTISELFAFLPSHERFRGHSPVGHHRMNPYRLSGNTWNMERNDSQGMRDQGSQATVFPEGDSCPLQIYVQLYLCFEGYQSSCEYQPAHALKTD